MSPSGLIVCFISNPVADTTSSTFVGLRPNHNVDIVGGKLNIESLFAIGQITLESHQLLTGPARIP